MLRKQPDSIIGSPKIMHQIATVIRQDPGGVKTLPAAFGAMAVERVCGRRQHMDPMGFGRAANPGFMGMQLLGLAQHPADLLHRGGDLAGASDCGPHDAAGAGTVPEEILADFRSALAGQQLTEVKIAHDTLHSATVLHRRAYPGGKRGADHPPAVRAEFALGLMLGDLHPDLR